MAAGRDFDFDWAMEGIQSCCLAFHPIHIYLNTEKVDRYRASETIRDQPERLWELRNIGPSRGAEDALVSLLEDFSKDASFVFARDFAGDNCSPAVNCPPWLGGTPS